MISLIEALNLLNLESQFNLIQLKDAYRKEIRKWHPDLNPHRLEQATEICQQINAAYDLLEAIAQSKGEKPMQGKEWAKWMQERLPEWQREFQALWRSAYHRACSGEAYASLHLNTCIANFRRAAIDPRPEWFLNCLFRDTPINRTHYRELLLKIAPNQKFRESWARKYFALEFGEGVWVFYLPASKSLLRSA